MPTLPLALGAEAHLVLEQQGHALEELVAIDGGKRDVEEEAVKHGLGDPLQREGKQQEGEAHQDAGAQGGQPCLLHVHNSAQPQGTGSPLGPSPRSRIPPQVPMAQGYPHFRAHMTSLRS